MAVTDLLPQLFSSFPTDLPFCLELQSNKAVRIEEALAPSHLPDEDPDEPQATGDHDQEDV